MRVLFAMRIPAGAEAIAAGWSNAVFSKQRTGGSGMRTGTPTMHSVYRRKKGERGETASSCATSNESRS